MNKYTLPKLGFEFPSLEPYIDAKTVEIHYTKHHQAYLDKFTAALDLHPELEFSSVEDMLHDLDKIPEDIRTAVQNAGGGYLNHNLYWANLTPDSQRSASVDKLLIQNFGSIEKFSQEFSASAANVFGSGWTWLVMDSSGKLKIMNTANQDNPISKENVKVLLALDVWEHAYYLKYQNRRPEYIQNWWKVVDWKEAEKRIDN